MWFCPIFRPMISWSSSRVRPQGQRNVPTFAAWRYITDDLGRKLESVTAEDFGASVWNIGIPWCLGRCLFLVQKSHVYPCFRYSLFFSNRFFSEWYELQHVTVCLMDPNGMLDHREMTRIFLVKQSPSYGFWVMFLTPQLRPAPFFRCFWGLVFSAVQSRTGL